MKVAASADRERTSKDCTLVQGIARGDLNSLGTLYDLYAKDLLLFATRLTGGAEAEDIVQTVFLRVLRIAATFDSAAPSARPWLFAIAARVAQERRRSLRRWAALLLRGQREPDKAIAPRIDVRWDLERGLARLSPSKRCVLLLAEVEGFSCPEIAEILTVPVGTVWTRLHHARRELRAFWEGAGA